MENERAGAGRDSRTYFARPNSQARAWGQEKFDFSCSADHEQDWRPYPVDAQSAESDDHITTSQKVIAALLFFSAPCPLLLFSPNFISLDTVVSIHSFFVAFVCYFYIVFDVLTSLCACLIISYTV